MDSRLILITLLIRLGAAAAIAAALVRSREFYQRLFQEERSLTTATQLVLLTITPYALGVLARISVSNFFAADLSLEGVLLVGVIGGRFPGLLSGILVALPAMFGRGEWLAMPFFVGAGLAAGQMRHLAASYEDVWSFSPFIDLGLYRWLRKNLRRPRLDWQISFLFVVLALRFVQGMLARAYPKWLFCVTSNRWPVELAAYATTAACVGLPLKIWNSRRMEMKLDEQHRLLMQARMEALQSQINPHFLFNTLNTVSSLVRFDPDMAREIIVKLASILRRLMRTQESFVTLREEVQFIDDYLDIEQVRFGRDKLRVIKELAPESLDVVVPAMLLQPLVENSIKHGLAPKVDGGSITLRSRLLEAALIVEVEDDGVGMEVTAAAPGEASGIGMANVAGRLKVLYGETAVMTISSGPAGGTLIVIKLPVLQSVETALPAGAKRA